MSTKFLPWKHKQSGNPYPEQQQQLGPCESDSQHNTELTSLSLSLSLSLLTQWHFLYPLSLFSFLLSSSVQPLVSALSLSRPCSVLSLFYWLNFIVINSKTQLPNGLLWQYTVLRVSETTQCALHNEPHSHAIWSGSLSHPTPTHCLLSHQGAIRQRLAQGHINMRIGGAGDRTTDLMISGWPALPPEPPDFITDNKEEKLNVNCLLFNHRTWTYQITHVPYRVECGDN